MEFKNIAVLGTGTMGSTIGTICLKMGFECTIYGRSEGSLNKAKEFIEKELMYEKEKMNNLKLVKSFEDLENCDFVIEALAEDLEIKRKIFNELDERMRDEVVLASTTSGLLPTDIAKNMKHKERFIIAHFWNPAHLIPLVEVVPGEGTSKETIEKTMEVLNRLNKKPIPMEKECKGFIGNRIQLAMLREAMYIVEQGYATIENVDKAVEYSIGRRLPVTGTLKSCDLGGTDIFKNVSSYLFQDLCDYKEESKTLKDLVEEGKLGSKSGEGFYKWDSENLEKVNQKRNEVLNYFNNQDKIRD
ncbi:3-hydroxyacyl-CoA dehydrogenase family protein [uncultured Clostridium sp.]|uniref:3-hydroxyacyl-CoA dehydrogenase family protein n=1 Tax=uncultured Clostridium sp. TaxID=59620 RepID=UPI002638FF09|nr:3-hydroxyacyl-CoA dehydrogenase family protein [uncultured Clostridium sp.]